MSYLVLARKYRPRNFSEMVGQEHVVQALTNALTQQRLHHAYLFTGTRGVGKTTVSRILAKSLNCTGPDGQGGITAEPCGVCPACTEIDSGRFPDYIELDAASNRGVDEVQSLLEQAVYKPVQGRFKVFMIDEVHMLTNTAFNAMLKTLEEPPEYLKFVLATTDPQKVPVTVLSRCLQFNLRPMVPETVFEHLSSVLQREHIPFEAQAVRLLARGARGSMRDALSLTDQAIAFGSGQLQEAAVRHMLGAVDRTHVLQLIAALAAGDGQALVQMVELLRTHGISAAGTLQELCLLLQRMAVLQAAPGMGADPADPDAEQLQTLAAHMPPDTTQLCYSIALHGQQELGWAPDEYAGLTMVLLRPLAFVAPVSAPVEKKTLTTPMAEPAPLAPMPPAAVQLPPPDAPAAVPEQAVAAEQSDGSIPPWMDLPPEAHQGTVAVLAEPVPEPPPQAPAIPAPMPASVPVPVTAAWPPTEVAANADPDQAQAPATELGDFWFQCVTQLLAEGRIAKLTRELALQAQLVARSDSGWLLQVANASLAHEQHVQRLAAVLQEVAACPGLQVQVGAVHDTPQLRNQQLAQARQRRAEEVVVQDADVQALQTQWGASIVPGSIRPLEGSTAAAS